MNLVGFAASKYTTAISLSSAKEVIHHTSVSTQLTRGSSERYASRIHSRLLELLALCSPSCPSFGVALALTAAIVKMDVWGCCFRAPVRETQLVRSGGNHSIPSRHSYHSCQLGPSPPRQAQLDPPHLEK